MKKLFLTLALMVSIPLVFVSCDDDSTDIWSELAGMTVGNMNMTVNGSTNTFTGVAYYQDGGKTYVATANMNGDIVAAVINGTQTKKYTLGAISDNVITSLLSGGFEISKFENNLAFKPKGDEIHILISGTLETQFSGNNLTGTFTGKAVKASEIEKLYNGGNTVTQIVSIVTGSNANTVSVSGRFNAKKTDNLSSLTTLFSK